MRDLKPVVVVGGGLGGLTAALLLARAGIPVRLFERAQALGGRAATAETQGFLLNQGPHALYRAGAGMRALKRVGLIPTGGMPSPSGGYAVTAERLHALPGGLVSLMSTGLLDLPGKLEAARWLSRLQKAAARDAKLDRTTVSEWVAGAISDPRVRALIQALIRLSTYSADPDRESAGAALEQLRLAVRANVIYLDGGWGAMVASLARAATAAGAVIETGQRVEGIRFDDSGTQASGITLAGQGAIESRGVILSGSPADAERLLGPRFRGRFGGLQPIRAACLDLCLRRLPDRRALFALGIDRPLYLSVHSAVAKLAPEGAAQIQLAKYLGPDDHDPEQDLEELERLADRIQPGWRPEVVERRWLPRLTVSHARVSAEMGGLLGRPAPELGDAGGVYLVGDWVGPEGMLADASFASASWVAERLSTQVARPLAEAI